MKLKDIINQSSDSADKQWHIINQSTHTADTI